MKLNLSDLGTFDNSIINSVNANNELIEVALENTLSRDGTTPNQMGDALDMNGYPILNLPAPGGPTSPARLQDVTGEIANLDLTVSLSGDVNAAASSSTLTTTVEKIQGVALGDTTATAGNVLIGSGTEWVSTPITGVVNLTSGGVASFGTGSVTGTEIAANTVALSNLAQLTADTVIGNSTGSTATPNALSKTQLTTLINPVTSSLSGAAPASGGGTTNFLRADATWALPPSAQTMQLLNTLTASSSASLSDTVSFTNTYTSYEIILNHLIPSSDQHILKLLLHAGGSFKTSGYQTMWTGCNPDAVNPQAGTTTYIPVTLPLASLTSQVLRNSTPGVSGVIRLYNPSSAGFVMASGEIYYIGYYSGGATSAPVSAVFAGYYATSAAIDGIELLMDSGNIASGIVKIYGIA